MKSYKTDYSNQVHQLAVSVSKHYWLTTDKTIRYQVKPYEINLAKLKSAKKNHFVHYIIRDHFSGVIYSEVIPSKKLIPVEEFLFRAWSQKEKFVFCGLPEYLTVPATVENHFPGIKEKVALLGVDLIKVTSGFQSGVRDIRTIEEYLKFHADRSWDDASENLQMTYVYPSTMEMPGSKETKIEFWRRHIDSVSLPPVEWLKSA